MCVCGGGHEECGLCKCVCVCVCVSVCVCAQVCMCVCMRESVRCVCGNGQCLTPNKQVIYANTIVVPFLDFEVE